MSLITNVGKPRSTAKRIIAFQGNRRDHKKKVLSTQARKKESILGRKSSVALLEQKPEAIATLSNKLHFQEEKLVFEALDELTAVLKQQLSHEDESENDFISTVTSKKSKSKASSVSSRSGKTARVSVGDPRLYAAKMIWEAINELSTKLQEEGREGSSVDTQIYVHPCTIFLQSRSRILNKESQQNTNPQKTPAERLCF